MKHCNLNMDIVEDSIKEYKTYRTMVLKCIVCGKTKPHVVFKQRNK